MSLRILCAGEGCMSAADVAVVAPNDDGKGEAGFVLLCCSCAAACGYDVSAAIELAQLGEMQAKGRVELERLRDALSEILKVV